MNRRQFLKRSLLTAGAAVLGAAGWGFGLEPRWIRLEEVNVALPGLPAHLDGFRIGVLADLHLGSQVPAEFIRRAATMLAARKPDLTVVAGDFTSERLSAAWVDGTLEPVKGAFAVLGNWDYYNSVARDYRSVRWLVNKGVLAAPGLWLAGVDDMLLGEPDLTMALAGAPSGAVRILLAHEPDFADRVRPEHRIALQISGHSHGGQIRLPFLGPVLLPPGGRKYHSGLYVTPGCRVYTSRGLGTAHIPVRFLCPPEVTLLTLRQG